MPPATGTAAGAGAVELAASAAPVAALAAFSSLARCVCSIEQSLALASLYVALVCPRLRRRSSAFSLHGWNPGWVGLSSGSKLDTCAVTSARSLPELELDDEGADDAADDVDCAADGMV